MPLHKVGLSNIIAVFMVVAAMTAHRANAENLVFADTLLPQICAPEDINSYECSNAKNYPIPSSLNEDCNVKILDEGYEGYFITGKKLRVIPYFSLCEAHASNFGGTLVFSYENGQPNFKSYERGLLAERCTVITDTSTSQRLICLTRYTGHGTTESTISEYRFTENFVEEISMSLDVIHRATDTRHNHGLATFDCSEELQVFGYEAIEPGPTPTSAKITVETSTLAFLAHHCAGLDSPRLSEIKPDEAAERTTSVSFILDANTRVFVPEESFVLLPTRPLSVAKSNELDITKIGKRAALIIGNSKYNNVPLLKNPAVDADLVAKTFKELHFQDVTVIKNATIDAMRKALISFSERAADSDWAIIYFAGHGIELEGRNYLIPTDAKISLDKHIRLETISLDDLIETAAGANQVRMVILDACRDNPFLKRMVRSVGTRSLGGSLAPIEPQKGSLVAYATRHGSVAFDGKGQNSPFAVAIAKHMKEPGLDIGLVFRRVRDDVLAATKNKQEPFTYGSLPGRKLSFYPVQ